MLGQESNLVEIGQNRSLPISLTRRQVYSFGGSIVLSQNLPVSIGVLMEKSFQHTTPCQRTVTDHWQINNYIPNFDRLLPYPIFVLSHFLKVLFFVIIYHN